MIGPMMKNCADEIEESLKQHGVKTYVILVKDPDSDEEVTLFGGSYAWALGRMELLNFEIKRAWANIATKTMPPR